MFGVWNFGVSKVFLIIDSSKNLKLHVNATMHLMLACAKVFNIYIFSFREAVFAEMGVALREDGDTVGVFSPKKVKVCVCLYCSAVVLC